MQKNFFIVFALLLFIPLAIAVEIDMSSEFSQGETLIAKISGDFYEEISIENVVFNRGHVRTSIIPFVVKINNDFYIYAQLLGKSPNNYSIVIENVKHIQGNRIIEENFQKNFSINENTADFSVNPGVIVTDKDFFIEVRNLQDKEITLDLTAPRESSSNGGFFASLFGSESIESDSSITLESGETKKINFKIENFEDFEILELSNENLKYGIPVHIFSREEKKKEKNFRFEPSELDVSIATNSETFKIIYLRNIGGETAEDISLKISDSLISYVAFSIDEINEIEENSSKKITVYFYSFDEEEVIEGQIIAISNGFSTSVPVHLNFLKDFIPVEEDFEEEFISETCSELNGLICGENQQCDGEIKYPIDGVCCIGTCTEIQESSVGKIIGWAILIIVVILLVWFYFKRYKGTKRVSDLMKVLKKK